MADGSLEERLLPPEEAAASDSASEAQEHHQEYRRPLLPVLIIPGFMSSGLEVLAALSIFCFGQVLEK